MNTILGFKIHALADSYPMLEHAELARLADSIRQDGQSDPVVLSSDGVVLDGRNRLRACEHAGVTPIVKRKSFAAASEEATAFIEAANLRRNMTPDQETMRRVMTGATVVRGVTSIEAAALLQHDPELAQRVLRGEISIKVAHNKMTNYARLKPPARVKRVEVATPAQPGVDDRLGALKAKSEAANAKREAGELLKELARARETADALSRMTAAPLPPVERYELRSGLREGTAVALASDWHVEEMVCPSNDTQQNAYNLAIAEHRVSRFFASVEWAIRNAQNAYRIRHLVLWLGGDFTTGQLHEENLETGQLAPLEAMLWCQERIRLGIHRLLDSDLGLARIDVPCSYGNHGRFTKRMRAGTGAGHNSDWLMYQSLASHFADDSRVQFNAGKEEHQFHNLYNKKLHFHHGHRVSFGGGVGGIMIPLNKASSQWDKVQRCDQHHYGHFHQYIDHGGVMVNGSLIGFNNYAMSIKATPEKPQQGFYIQDSKRGKAQRTPLWVDDPEVEVDLWSGGRGGL